MELPSKVLLTVAGLYALVVASGALNGRCTPPTKTTTCRRELHAIRGMTLGGNAVLGFSFADWRAKCKSNQDMKSLPAHVCEYCQMVSRKINAGVIDVGTENGVQCYVDPWGNAYHVDLHANLKLSFMRKLRHVFVGDYIFWSSGPNGINERGAGDDIFEDNRAIFDD